MKQRTKELIDYLDTIIGYEHKDLDEIKQRLMEYDELRQAYGALIDFMSEIADNLEKRGKSK